MDSSGGLMHCEVCSFSMHKNNWETHISGKKHSKAMFKLNKKNLTAKPVGDPCNPSFSNDNGWNVPWNPSFSNDDGWDVSKIIATPMCTTNLESDASMKTHMTSQDQLLNTIVDKESDPSGNFKCEVCKVSVNLKVWDDHVNGKRHKYLLDISNSETRENPDETYVRCEACNVSIQKHSWDSHVSGKKHKWQQEVYYKEHTTVYVTGVEKFSSNDLKKLFSSFGEVTDVVKQPWFSLIQFKEKLAAEKALFSRVFSRGVKLMVHKYVNRYSQKKKAEQLPAKPVVAELSESQVGTPELPVELPNSSLCPPNQNVFDWHVQSFISQVELEDTRYYDLCKVVSDVEYELGKEIPHFQVLIFGSCGSNLAFRKSDVDLFLQCVGDPPPNFVRKEAKVFYKSSKFAEFFAIPSARVPIVRFRHIPTNFKCDLTCSSKLGVCNSRLVRFLITLDPRIKPLIMVIKYWTKVYGITGSTQNFTTYSVVMLVIFYLQQLSTPLLPPIATLQRLADHQEFSSGWMCNFCDEEWKVHSEWLQEKNTSTLKELLAGFFQFYRDFDYQNVICPLVGYPVSTELFKNADDLPDEMQLYKEKLKNEPDNSKLKFKTNVMIRAQDPLELHWNITKNVPDKIFFLFTAACGKAYEIMTENDEGSLLSGLLSIDTEVLSVSTEHYATLRIGLLNVASGDISSSGMTVEEQYKLTTEVVLLVMRQVLKTEIKECESKLLSKVQKVNSSQDVHTLSEDKDLVYYCLGNSNVIEQRKKMKSHLDSLNLSLTRYELEVCISNALQFSNASRSFSFDLKMSSLQRCKSLKSFEIMVSGKDTITKKRKKKSDSFSKEVANFLLYNFKWFVKHASDLIIETISNSPDFDVKSSIKELFDSKMAKLPNLNDILNLKSLSEERLSTLECDKSILQKQCSLLGSIEKVNNKEETLIADSSSLRLSPGKRGLEDEVCLGRKETISDTSNLKHFSVESSFASGGMENMLLPKTIMACPNTDDVIDEFISPDKPDQLVGLPLIDVLKNDEKDKTLLRNIEGNSNENNKRRMDLQHEAKENTVDGIDVVLNERTEIKPNLYHRRPQVYEEGHKNKYRKPNFNSNQNLGRSYHSQRSSGSRNVNRGVYRQRSNSSYLPNKNLYNNYRCDDQVDISSKNPSSSSFNKH